MSIIRSLWVFLILVFAAQIALAQVVAQKLLTSPGLSEIHLDVAILSVIICTLSGVASLLQRISKELKANPDQPLKNPVLFIATNIFGSWVAGALAFVAGQMFHWDVWNELGSMIVTSYAGAMFIEAIVEARMGKLVHGGPG